MNDDACAADAVRVRAGISRLREQAESATPGPWKATPNGRVLGRALAHIPNMCLVDSPVAESHSGNAAHIARWSPSSVLVLCDYLDQQADAYATMLRLHRQDGADRCVQCARGFPCAAYRRAEAGLTPLAALITTIEGAS